MRVPILLTLVAWLTVSGASVREDMAAFDAGDYATAFEEWRSLAHAGEAEAQAQVALAGLYLAGQGTRADAVRSSARRCARKRTSANAVPPALKAAMARNAPPA